MPLSPSVENSLPAVPVVYFMLSPTMAKMARRGDTNTCPSCSRSARAFSASASLSTVQEMLTSLVETKSTTTPCRSSTPNTRAKTVGVIHPI